MLQKTRGIVFRFTRYGDTSIIVTIFTDLFGLQSYIINGIRSKSAKNKIALYQPLTMLELVAYHKETNGIQRIKEAQCFYHYKNLQHDIRKSAISMFLNEVINKAVKEQSHTEEIANFFFESFKILDQLTGGEENFHLTFLLRLSRFLGFGPQNANEILQGRLLEDDEEILLKRILTLEYGEPLAMGNRQRRNILEALMRFYRSHIENFTEIKSFSVLREVLE